MKLRGAFVAVVGLCLCAFACSVPKVSIRVTGNTLACVVELKNPFFMRGDPVVEKVEVYVDTPERKAPECQLTAIQDPVPLSKWEIGTVPTGYKLERCIPIEQGKRYRVAVYAVGGLGARPFAIRSDGTVDDLGVEWK